VSVKYRGLILGSRVTWREHVDVNVRKAENLLWACRRAYGGAWCLGPRVVHWLYVCHQAVRHLCILSVVARLSDSQCQEETKQNSKIGCLGITGAARTTPTRVMEAIGVSGVD